MTTSRRIDEEEDAEKDATTPLTDTISSQLDCASAKSVDDDIDAEAETNADADVEKDDELRDMGKASINTRSLKLSKLRSDISLTDVLELITLGPIETCHYDLTDDPSTNQTTSSVTLSPSPPPTYRSVIISFMDSFTANECYLQMTDIMHEMKHLLKSPKLILTPVSSLPLSNYIQNEINNNGASRALCLSNLPYNLSEKILITELSKFGALQSVEYNVDKNAAFAYFTSIFNAIKCFDQLPLSNSILSDSKIFYSNDGNSVNIPAFSSSNSFMNATFADKSEIDLFKENHPNNMLAYSRTSTSLSSPRISTDFTSYTSVSNVGPSYEDNRNSDGSRIINGSRNFNKNARESLDSSNNDGLNIDKTDVQIINESADIHAVGAIEENVDVDDELSNNLNSSTLLNSSGFFQDSYTPVVLHEFMHQPYTPQMYDTPPVYRTNGNRSVTSLLQNNIGNRTVYLGGLPNGTTSEDVCNKIRGGILENIKLLPDKKAAFLTFIYHHDAANFVARTFKDSLFINSKNAKVGWGRNSGNLNPDIQIAVDGGACRNLYIGINEDLEDQDDYELVPIQIGSKQNKEHSKSSTEEDSAAVNNVKDSVDTDKDSKSTTLRKLYHAIPDEDILRRDFSIFGEIEQINYFKNGSCAFINFTNILSCIKAVEDFQSEESEKLHSSFENRYTKFKISYGKDRCGNPPKKKRNKKVNSRSRTNITNDQFNYALDSNQSIDTDLALKFDSAITGIGISSPSAAQKVKSQRHLPEEGDLDQNNVVVSDIEYDSISNAENLKVGVIGDGDLGMSSLNARVSELGLNSDEVDNVIGTENESEKVGEEEEGGKEEDEEDEEDEEVDIVTETLDTSFIPPSESRTDNTTWKSQPRNKRANSKSNRPRLYSSSRSSSMTSFQNYPYNNSRNHSFNYTQDNYANEAPGYILTPQPYYYPSQAPTTSQFPVSVPHTPMGSYNMNYYLAQGGPPPPAYYYYSTPQQQQHQSQQNMSTPLSFQQKQHQQSQHSYSKPKNYKRYQKNKQYAGRNFDRGGTSESNNSSQEFNYNIESSTPNGKK